MGARSGMPENGVLGVAVALCVIGFGVTEASAACDGRGPCRGYAYAPPPVVYAPPPVYAYAPPPGAYGVIIAYGYYPSFQYLLRQRLLLRGPL